jgi:putative nucleotidyltransferase with HDIG domain
VLIAIGLGAAWLLPPSNAVGELPGDDALHSLSTVSIKANRDYTIPDPDATAALRNEAAAQVRSVYDFDVGESDKTLARIAMAFSSARDDLLATLANQPVKKTRPKKGETPNEDELAITAAQPRYAEFVKELQAVVDEVEYRELSRLRFSTKIEHAITLLAGGVIAGEIAPSRELLFAERGNGITLRRVGTLLAHGEREVRDVERIPDLAAVRFDLGRLAQGLAEVPGSNSGVARAALGLAPDLEPEERRVAALVAARLVSSNISYNPEETELRKIAAESAVKPVVLQYARGEKIISEGERIEKRHLLVFHFIRDQARALDSVQIRSGATIFTVLLVVAAFSLARRTVRRFRPSKRDLIFLAATLLGNLGALRAGLAAIEQLHDRPAWLTNELASLALPLVGGTMLVRMLRSGESSVVFALVFAPLSSLLLNTHVAAAVGLVASLVAANRLGGRGGRSALPAAALEAGVAAAVAFVAIALFDGRPLWPLWPLPETARLAIAAVIGAGIVSPLSAVLVAPLVEFLFGYISESRLARLANLNNPVLKELIIKAPGTYHHSLIVGALAEAAARRIGAHPLLARVGGYYHDLGKLEAPLMYSENQKAENRLEKLPPEEAAAVVRRHVSDGVARARDAHLPRVVTDFILQHHGTSEAGHFLSHAAASADESGLPPPLSEGFRYSGPRPKSREVALVMLADAVEAASRAVQDPTPERLAIVVPRVIQHIVAQGELDECELTLADIHRTVIAFQSTLAELRTLSRVDVLPGVRPPPQGPGPVPAPDPTESPLRAVR